MVSKVALNTAGTLCVVLGVLGVFLPLLPATPFLLLASACYLRGSERLHRWLVNNRYLGPYITNIKDKRGLPLRAKIYTLALLWASVLFSAYRFGLSPVSLALVVTGLCTTWFVTRLKTLKA